MSAVRIMLHLPYLKYLTTHIMAGWARYAERTLIQAGPRDVVCMLHPPEEAYLDFLETLGVGPPRENIVLATPDPSARDCDIAAAFFRDTNALSRVVKRTQGASAVCVSPFYASQKEFALAERLASMLGKPVRVLGGNAEAVARAGMKHIVRAKALELGIPIAPGEVVELLPCGNRQRSHRDIERLGQAIERARRLTGRALVRGSNGASGSSTYRFDGNARASATLLRRLRLHDENIHFLVDTLVEVKRSPNVQTFIPPQGKAIACVSASDQRLDAGLCHMGNACPSQAATLDGMVADAMKMSKWLRSEGFTGLAGFDFVEYDDASGRPSHFLAEINPRVNSAAYPTMLREKLGAKPGSGQTPMAFISENVKTRARCFTQLRDAYGDLLFDGTAGLGLFPYNTGCLPYGKFTAAFFGPSLEAVDRIRDSFHARPFSR